MTTEFIHDLDIIVVGGTSKDMREMAKHKLSGSITDGSEDHDSDALVVNITCDEEPTRKRVKRHLTSRLKRLLSVKKARTSSKKSRDISSLHSSYVAEIRRDGNDSTCLRLTEEAVTQDTGSSVRLEGVNLDSSPNHCSMGKCESHVDTNVPMLLATDSPVCSRTFASEDYLALDCEFVGVGPRKLSSLGRCSIVDFWGQVVCDIYSRPDERITDYRTPWSGIRKADLTHALPFELAKNRIDNILKGKVVVGHALHNDFSVLGIHHPSHLVCDTAKCNPLKRLAQFHGKKVTSLKALTFLLLGYPIQEGEHCSVEDSRASMQLFRLVRADWEAERAGDQLQCTSDIEATSENNNSFLNDNYWPEDICN